ncbi:ShlB/FhaC/HecB family hemolysin secretion/activation protein [Oceanicoccus sagamiensis]|uniref:Haemolysin activator HlyB C-terminal domain-containing protein n=1 Tax=Oceanicoccus sagamiensis TaxID=716816 RepID=A0A1X9NG20_9GAMM|nr:ShlB/FhaC/HecB family hemolysin secretion/activation protein [Oceanicoccus sagamiensis]ARN74449.1 hypothetical protein BST96_10185 [Oceanicoccus sagamiensis]
MRRLLAFFLLPMMGTAVAQIDDRGYNVPPASGQGVDFSFGEESYLTADTDIPPVSERDEGPSIEVTEFQFESVPEFPELGITRAAVEELAESLRQEYSQKPNQLASGYTEKELQLLAELLPTPDDKRYTLSISELEQIADYILSVSDGDALGGLRQYEVKGLVDLLAAQRSNKNLEARDDLKTINSLLLDDLIRLIKRQRAERGINFYELEDIAAKISAFYRSKGIFLAKAYIPVQQVEDGIVTFGILEGVLGGLTVAGNQGYSSEKITQPFQPLVGKAANSESIEEALYLVNDYPGLVLQGSLSSGENIGETSLDLNVVEEKSWRATVTADNHGAVFTGDNRLLTMVDFFNPTGRGDILTVGYLKSWSPLNSDVAVFQYRAPVYDERTFVYVSADVNDFTVDGDGDRNIDDLNIEGTNTNYTLGMDRWFKRTPGLGISGGFAITEKETDIDADVDLPSDGDKVQGLEFNSSFNQISKKYELMNIAMMSIQYGDFKNDQIENLNQDEDFYKLAIDWSTLKLLNLPFTDYSSYILATTKIRYSESGLPAFEQLPLGGADAVRAFDVSEFSADQAGYIGLEWYVEFPITWISESIEDKLKVALFVDGAYGSTNIEINSRSDDWVNMSGVGVLFKFNWNEMLGTKISVAKPTGSKSNMDDFGDDADSVQTFVEVTFVYD